MVDKLQVVLDNLTGTRKLLPCIEVEASVGLASDNLDLVLVARVVKQVVR